MQLPLRSLALILISVGLPAFPIPRFNRHVMVFDYMVSLVCIPADNPKSLDMNDQGNLILVNSHALRWKTDLIYNMNSTERETTL